jgi:hypothetical protein
MIPNIVFLLLITYFVFWTIITTAEVVRTELKKKALHHTALLEKDYHARLEALQLRLIEYERQEKDRIGRRIIELSEKPSPTLEERRELSWMKADQSEYSECATSTYLESAYIVWDREQGGASIAIHPYLTVDWMIAEKQGMTAIAGTIFHLLTSPLIGRPFRRASYILVRVNESCPWKRLLIIHEEGADFLYIVYQHLQHFIPNGPMVPPAPKDARWDPEMHEWYIPTNTW